MTRTLPRITRQVPALRLPRPDALDVIARLEAVQASLSRTEDGHWRRVHWLLLALVLCLVAYAPFLVPHVNRQQFDYFGLPLCCMPAFYVVFVYAVLMEEQDV